VVVTVIGNRLDYGWKIIYSRGKNMPNKKDDQNPEFDDAGQKSGSKVHKESDSNSGIGGDEMNTAGGRKGNFSDKDRDKETEWSPGSTGPSDQ
jgi:hypothetical protein